MSERGNFRGGMRSDRGGGNRGRGRPGSYNNQGRDDKKKEPILDLSKYMDKKIRVKFSGGRE
ncbi:hypothetical protein HK096_007699, partial [Nowakowskiella sp. JEL0078]